MLGWGVRDMVFIANDLDKCDNYISIKNSTDEHDTQTQPAQTPRPCTMYVQCMYNVCTMNIHFIMDTKPPPDT